MAFIDMVISKVSIVLSHLSEITGLSSIVLICTFSFLFLFLIFGLIILLKLRGIKKILIDVNRRMNAISIISRQQSSKYNPKINPHIRLSTLSQNTQDSFIDSTQNFNNAQEFNATSSVQDEHQGNGSEEISDKLSSRNRETTDNFDIEEISKPLTSDWHIKSAILKLINENDQPIYMQDIGKKLSGEYFDGNYSLILNVLNQLEKEGLIEGTSKGGKVLYRKKL
jgi:hypothetical protein